MRDQGPVGLFNDRKLFLSAVKTFSNKVSLVSSWHTNSKNCSKGLNGANAANRWKNGGKSRVQGPDGLLNYQQLFFSAVKAFPNKVGLVSSWHTKLKNCSKDLKGAIAAKRWENAGNCIRTQTLTVKA